MRILQISEQVSPVGGCERMLRDTCGLLTSAGHEVTTLVAEDSVIDAFEWPIERLPRSRGPIVTQRVKPVLDAILKRVRPDVIHVHNAQDFLSPFLVAHMARAAPTLRYVHDARLFCPQLRTKWLLRENVHCPHPMGLRCLMHCYPIDAGDRSRRPNELGMLYGNLAVSRRLPAVAVGSAYMREQLLVNGFAAERIHLLAGFTAKGRGYEPPETETAHVLAIGRFDGAKGLELLPQTLARLKTPDWQATIVGDGAGLEATRARAAALGLGQRVRFPGNVQSAEIDGLYRRASIVVVPSRVPEAFGLVGIEAMAFGKPVVACDTGGVREWLLDDETGYLVPPGDEAGFARRIDQLLGEPDKRARLGACGREQVELRFRPERHLRLLLDLYASLTTRRRRHAWSNP
jgi:glycosyltransferase involved in cell wall biosynthesis